MATFNASAGDSIPLATAKQWTANYKATIKPGEIQAHYYSAEIIQRLLHQDKSVGIRIHYSIDEIQSRCMDK